MSGPRDFSLTFGGAAEREIKAAGRYLRVLATPTADVFISIDGGSELQRGAGQQVHVPAGFTRFSVRSAVAQTVRISTSETSQDDARSNVALSVSATVAPGADVGNGGDVSILAASSAQVLAANLNRLAAIITNLTANTVAVRVGKAGVGAASGIPLDPGDSVTLATTAAIHVYNPHSGAQTVSALEVIA